MTYWIVSTIKGREITAIGNYEQGIGIRGAAWRLGIPIEPIFYFENAPGFFFVHIDSKEQLETLIRNSPEAIRSHAKILTRTVYERLDKKGHIIDVFEERRVPKGVAKVELRERVMEEDPLSDYEMHRLVKAYADATREKPPEPLKVGDVVEVVQGPFKYLQATITEVGRNFVKIRFLIPGYTRFPIKMALDYVKMVEK